MGAGCSSNVLTKYKHLKSYLQTKPCLTFESVTTYMPSSDSSPVILVGENHALNESDFVNFLPESGPKKIEELVESSRSVASRCATLFTAMKNLVSDCENPTTQINFLIESPDIRLPENLKLPETKGFNLEEVRKKTHEVAQYFAKGLSIVYYDIFYFERTIYGLNNQAVDRPGFDGDLVTEGIKTTLKSTFQSMDRGGYFVLNLPILFTLASEDTTTAMKIYREKYEAIFAFENGVNMKLREMWRDDNKMSEHEIKAKTPMLFFWMFELVYWVKSFTEHTIRLALFEHNNDVYQLPPKDLLKCREKIDNDFSAIVADPKRLFNMFELMTTCGDVLTYVVYLRRRALKKDNIYVLYGGEKHAQNFVELMDASNTHRKDYVRKVDAELSKRMMTGRKVLSWEKIMK